MHQKKIAKLKHKVFYKNKPRINSGDNKSQRHSILSIPSITKRLDNICNNSRLRRGKKRTLSLHHNLAYVSYSIPLLSSLALLVVGLIAANPFGTFDVDKTSAVGNVIDVDYQRVMRSTATLTITPATSGGHGATNGVATEIIPGSVGYRAHDVLASVSDSTSYMLNVSYTPSETTQYLHLADGLMKFGDVSSSGVEGGNNIPTNSWGFAWGEQDDVDEDMTYYPMQQYNTSGAGLSKGILEYGVTGEDRTALIDKKLVFAANFSPNTLSGHYVASILLSLSATPNDISRLSELTDLQSMTPEICQNSPIGDISKTDVMDLRDPSKKYHVIKIAENHCWMMESLSLDLDGVTLKPSDTNIEEPWESTTGPSEMWTETSYDAVKYWNGKNEKGNNVSGYADRFGYYYSYEAATAGHARNITQMGNYLQVTQDICPRGWKIPSYNTYSTVISKGDYSGYDWRVTVSDPLNDSSKRYLYFYGSGYLQPSATPTLTVKPTYDNATYGYYWSSTIKNYSNNNSGSAYYFSFNNYNSEGASKRPPTYNSTQQYYYGLPIRCIAKTTSDMYN